ncbi:hypothetical protein [uncultured Croceitalea sp.]|uniref:hypothetical protein n=1 Tax=uncultured Croceitalea sp. TaxID=1798908 RepID=UPI003305BFF8
MIYIISGASRSGKTLLAKKMLAKKGVTYLSLDWLIMGFTNGIPEYGIHDLLFPDEIAKRAWSFLKAMFESMLHVETDCIVEGEALLPELIVALYNKYPKHLKICFVGYADITPVKKFENIKAFSSGKNDWLFDKSDEYILDHVNNMIAHSKLIKQSCKTNNVTYFDTSKDFMGVLEQIMKYLLDEV